MGAFDVGNGGKTGVNVAAFHARITSGGGASLASRRWSFAVFAHPALAAADPNKVLRLVVRSGGDRVRSGADLRRQLRHRQRGDLRAVADLRLPRAAGQARADDRRGDARGERRRQDLYVPPAQGHLLHARPRVQGRQARARRAGFRVHVHALLRSEASRAVCVHAGRQDQGPGRACGGSEEVREVQLRCEAARSRGDRPLHAADSPRADRLQFSLRRRAYVVRGRRSRGDRGVRQRDGRASGGHRRLHAAAMEARVADRT